MKVRFVAPGDVMDLNYLLELVYLLGVRNGPKELIKSLGDPTLRPVVTTGESSVTAEDVNRIVTYLMENQ